MLDRETITQIAVSAAAVGIFIVLAVAVSANFGAENHLSEAGGFALVGGVAAFVLVTTVAGLWLARQEFDEEGDAADGV